MKRLTKYFNHKVLAANKDLAFQKISAQPSPDLRFYKNSWDKTVSIFNDIKLNHFPSVALVGPCSHFLVEQIFLRRVPQELTLCDHSPQSLSYTLSQLKDTGTLKMLEVNDVKVREKLIGDDWNFQQNSLNLIVSCMHLHHSNNPEKILTQMLGSLRPDGCFIGTTLGRDNLEELRISMVLAENQRYGGVSPHVSPFMSLPDIGNILQKCGYRIATISRQKEELKCKDSLELISYIKFLGQNSSLLGRRKGCYKDLFYATVALYESMFKGDEGVSVTTDLLSFIGWKYSEAQKEPAKRGSQSISFEEWMGELEKIEGKEVKHGTISEEAQNGKKKDD